MKIRSRKNRANIVINPSIELMVSLFLFIIALTYSLCIGQKAYDSESFVGFRLSYWLPGALGMLALTDAGIVYIDNKKNSLWSKIVFAVVSVAELVIVVIAGHDYFIRYPFSGPDNAYRYIARALVSLIAVANVVFRGLKFFDKVYSKLPNNNIISSFGTLGASSLLAMGCCALESYIQLTGLEKNDKSFYIIAFTIAFAACIASIVVAFIPDKDIKKTALMGSSLFTMLFSVVALITFIVCRDFNAAEFKVDYWACMTGGAATLSSFIPFVISALSLAKKKSVITPRNTL